jgi:predicted membrane protein
MEAAMYCPKCGAEAEAGRFCKYCGTNLTLVSSALSKSEQKGSSVTTRGRGTTLGVFHEAHLTNAERNLDGHSAASVFGSVVIDLTAADLPPGETTVHVYSIFGSIEVLVPNDVSVRITGVTLFSGVKVRGQDLGGGIFSLNEHATPGYTQAARRLHIDATSIFSGVKIRR